MRCVILLLTVLLLSAMPGTIWGQTAEKIYGKNRVLKSNEYYLEQMRLWRAEVDKDLQNADAWYNYYRASRNAYVVGEEDNSQSSKGLKRFERLKGIVDEMEKHVPDSYEYNYVRWLNGNSDLSLFPYLERAHALSPQSAEPIMSLIFYYEIVGDYEKRDESIEAYYQIGDYSPGLLNYGYNLLTALDQDALVFTEGDKDTEAILLLTRGKKYRPDVRMLNVNLLLIKEYRERVFGELEIPQLEFDPLADRVAFATFQHDLIRHVATHRKTRPVYAAVTVSKAYSEAIRPNMYLTGLAYLYSPESIESIPILEKNVEQRFLLDYLEEYFPLNDISVGNVQSMNGNYLLPFAALSKHYLSVGNTAKAEYYRNYALKVATAAGILDEFEAVFAEN